MKNNKGFTIIEGLLILVIVGIVGGTAYYVWNSRQQTNKDLTTAQNETSAVKVTKKTSSAQKPATPDPTADWTAYSSKDGNFSLKYPKTWVQPTDQDLCNADLLSRSVYLGPDAQSVLKCGSEFFGQIWVGSVAADKQSNYDLDSKTYTNITRSKVTVDGVSGQKISGVAGPKSDDNVLAPLEGTIEVHYIFFTNNITYSARYTQAPQGHNPSTNVLDDFNTMVIKTLKFSS